MIVVGGRNSLALNGISGLSRTLTVSGASTLQVTVQDPARTVLRSEALVGLPRQSRLEYGDRTWRLVQVKPGVQTTDLTFEDDLFGKLRDFTGPLVVSQATQTRSDFIANLGRRAGVKIYVQPDQLIPPVSSTLVLEGETTDTNGKAIPGSTRVLSAVAIAGYALAAGCPQSQLTDFVAIALAESSGRPTATNGQYKGLWQIGTQVHADIVAAAGGDVNDPAQNAAMAALVSKGWTDKSPWQAYTGDAGSGVPATNPPAYVAKLPEARAAVAVAGESSSALAVAGVTPSIAATATARGRVLGTGQWQVGTADNVSETFADAITRYAQELNWRFMSTGKAVYVGSDAWLKKRLGRPVAVRELTAGVGWLTGEWDLAKADGNDLTFTVSGQPFSAGIGQACHVTGAGLLDGEWLCHEIRHDIATPEATDVTLSRSQVDIAVQSSDTSAGAEDEMLLGVSASPVTRKPRPRSLP